MATHATSDDRIGEYKFVRTIYPGATSIVMEVLHEPTGRRYAVKQLLASRGVDAAERRAFAFEAKLGMELQHPNLIRVHQYVKDPEQPYFVMDYFPGFQLRLAMHKPKDFPIVKTSLHRIITQAARGLAYMHDKGWIHRDVKPENLMANKSGEVRVIDYTLSRRPISGIGKILGMKVPRQGTKSYMSPEQIRCESPAPTADIYSFGITCYEFACGRQPFRANSENELLNKHIRETPNPPTSYNKDVTKEFSDLVLEMIRKKPADRPQSLHEFLARFAKIRIFQTDPVPDPASRDGF
ncbi:serine/threonine protein kinase [Tundrisphaera sp. TA3]|uniref:serine/threonine protein kinase n=1 Tax=Tundrisphaera sp. TA3 TaxID=3435775 RepID=UPI003EC1401A